MALSAQPSKPSSMPAPQHIDLWLCREQDVTSHDLLTHYRTLLSAEEKHRLARFKFEADQHRFLVTRALVRTTLSHYHPDVAPAEWRFRTNAHGRPSIANPLTHPVSFNLSHTAGLSVLAVSQYPFTGVDVEYRLRRNTIEESRLAHRFFSPTETDALLALPESARKERFFRLWTLKEAYIKACGKGLAIPLSQFSFDFPPSGAIQIAFTDALDDHPAHWQFWQYTTEDDYMIAVACKAFPTTIQKVNGFQVTPTQQFKCVDNALKKN